MVTSALASLGIRWRQAGRHGDRITSDPAAAIGEADIVIGYGRSVLEAMSCGRPAYVLDHMGSDGWVTADTYEALEADGFSGLARDRRLDAVLLREDLARYDARMALTGCELVWSRHSSFQHARELVDLFRRTCDGEAPPTDQARELARVVRSQWHADWRSIEIGQELEATRRRTLELETELARARERATQAEADATGARTDFDALVRTRRWRASQALLRPVDRIRQRRTR